MVFRIETRGANASTGTGHNNSRDGVGRRVRALQGEIEKAKTRIEDGRVLDISRQAAAERLMVGLGTIEVLERAGMLPKTEKGYGLAAFEKTQNAISKLVQETDNSWENIHELIGIAAKFYCKEDALETLAKYAAAIGRGIDVQTMGALSRISDGVVSAFGSRAHLYLREILLHYDGRSARAANGNGVDGKIERIADAAVRICIATANNRIRLGKLFVPDEPKEFRSAVWRSL